MSNSSRSPRRPKRRQAHNVFDGLIDLARRVGLRGPRQWQLIQYLHRAGYKWRRKIRIGRRELATLLEALDFHTPPGTLEPELLGTNTRRRLHRVDELGLVTIVEHGGRKPGCRKKDGRGLVGLANDYYPGPKLVPAVIVDKWIAEDQLREAGIRPQSEGELLELGDLALDQDDAPGEPELLPAGDRRGPP